MKILFYSLNPSFFDEETFHFTWFPRAENQWKDVLQKNPNVSVCVVTQKPGMFLTDSNQKSSSLFDGKLKYIFLQNDELNYVASIIQGENPNVVVASSFWVTPFDWTSVQDSLLGEFLQKKGLNVIFHPSESSALCFDKNSTRLFLQNNSFNFPTGYEVHHELFWSERGKSEVKTNVYKEYILSKIQKLNYPVVIKDCYGLSSYGMEVCKTFNQAKAFLLSKKNNGNKIVEEYIDGLQFGVEVWGSSGKYEVSPSFLFSVNQYGITSPKQSIKVGPVKNEKLENEVLRICELLKFSGVAQFDVVYDGKKWFILDINPRLSGMSSCVACCENTSVVQKLINLACQNQTLQESDLFKTCLFKTDMFKTLDIKIKNQEQKILDELIKLPFVKCVNQTVNDLAKQHRESGFCELILCDDSFDLLLQDLDFLREKFPNIIEEQFYQTAKKMIFSIAKTIYC